MPEIDVYNLQKKKVGSLKLSEDFFPEKLKLGLIHQAVKSQRAAARSGTASVKNRHNVKGSTAKIYRQKGTGNARHGDGKAPVFVGGGQAFGPKARDWSQSLPKKMRRKAIRSVIAERHKEERLYITDSLDFKEIKTKKALEVFNKLGIHNALIVLDKPSEKVSKSLRNVPGFKVACLDGLNVVDVLTHEYLVMTQEALSQVQGFLT